MMLRTVKTVHMNSDTHNGWTNYETWRVWLDLSSNAPFYQFWLGSAHDQIKRNTETTGKPGHDLTTLEGLRQARNGLAQELENTYEQLVTPPAKDTPRPALAQDLAQAALALVNWPELAAWLIRRAIPELEKHFNLVRTMAQPGPEKAIEIPVRITRLLPDRKQSTLP